MDGRRFDHLSRRLASLGTRRQAVKALAGALAATVAARRTAGAQQSCTAQYRACQSDGQCCAGAVCQSGMCQPGCRIDGVFKSASTPQPGNTCARCTPAASTTAWSPANQGMSCWSGNLCGGASTCQAGTCQPINPVTCQPLTACHAAGECNPGTGLCSHPPAPAGTPCGTGATCVGGFAAPGLTCNGSGSCVGGQTVPCAPYVCGETACRTDCAHDGHCANGYRCCAGACIDVTQHVDHCGTCGTVCPRTDCLAPVCTGGICGSGTATNVGGPCAGGTGTCHGNGTCCENGTGINFGTDPDNCGTCGNACPRGECLAPVCAGGVCGTAPNIGESCAGGTGTCHGDGSCCENGTGIIFQTDVDNCGTCGTACPRGECLAPDCTGGICGSGTPTNAGGACSNETGTCHGDGTCCENGTGINFGTDPDNCGTCGTLCPRSDCLVPDCADGICGSGTPTNAGGSCANETGTCTGSGICCENPVELGVGECSGDGDCDAGEVCWNGGCFGSCSTYMAVCPSGCASCVCSRRIQASSVGDPTYCVDAGYGIGNCSVDADCLSGSLCSVFSNDSGRLCTRPCHYEVS